MANLQDLIQKYVEEAAVNNIDKKIAANEVAGKLRSLKYKGQDNVIPKADLLDKLRVVKGTANESHIEVLETIIAILEEGSTE